MLSFYRYQAQMNPSSGGLFSSFDGIVEAVSLRATQYTEEQ